MTMAQTGQWNHELDGIKGVVRISPYYRNCYMIHGNYSACYHEPLSNVSTLGQDTRQSWHSITLPTDSTSERRAVWQNIHITKYIYTLSAYTICKYVTYFGILSTLSTYYWWLKVPLPWYEVYRWSNPGRVYRQWSGSWPWKGCVGQVPKTFSCGTYMWVATISYSLSR